MKRKQGHYCKLRFNVHSVLRVVVMDVLLPYLKYRLG